MLRTLAVINFCAFTASLSTRPVDPLIPPIASDFMVSSSTAAMLATAFAAYGLVQPVLGPVADTVGKARVMIVCLSVLTISSLLTAVVSDFWSLFALRMLAGAACGGSFPVAMAIVADLVPINRRQIMIGRLLAATISGSLLGAALSGIVADILHWRAVFAIIGVVTGCAVVLAIIGLRNLPPVPPQTLEVRAVIRRFGTIFRIPAARVCYIAVALEGVFLFGVFPYVAVLLAASGETRATIAGLILAAFAGGGIVYSLAVPYLLNAIGQKWIMIGGGLIMAFGLAILALQPAWQWQCLLFALAGCGFYMLHGSIQVYVTELAPESRSSAVAFHTFSFFIGQGVGPVVIGAGLAHIGAPPTLIISAVMLALIGLVSAHLLVRSQTSAP